MTANTNLPAGMVVSVSTEPCDSRDTWDTSEALGLRGSLAASGGGGARPASGPSCNKHGDRVTWR